MDKIADYTLAFACSVEKLIDCTRLMIQRQGWQPLGGVVMLRRGGWLFGENYFVQAMVKYAPTLAP